MPDEKISRSLFAPSLGAVLERMLRLVGIKYPASKRKGSRMDDAIPTLLGSGALARPESEDSAAQQPSNEQRLIDALDEAALRFAGTLLDDEVDENNHYKVSWQQRADTFKMIRDWVAVRRRTDISEPGEDQAGVDKMRARLKTAQTLPPVRGIDPPPPRRVGRPTNEQRKKEQAYKIAADAEQIVNGKNDDSAMRQKMQDALRDADKRAGKAS